MVSVLQGCSLRCMGTGLSHLFAPLVTLATMPAHHGSGVVSATASAGVLTVIETKIWVRFLSSRLSLTAKAVRDIDVPSHLCSSVSVILQCTMASLQGEHGSLAVRTEGSGALRGVRVINLLRGTLFWFKVDSAVPATIPVKREPASKGVLGQPVTQEVRRVSDGAMTSMPFYAMAPVQWMFLNRFLLYRC